MFLIIEQYGNTLWACHIKRKIGLTRQAKGSESIKVFGKNSNHMHRTVLLMLQTDYIRRTFQSNRAAFKFKTPSICRI